MNVHIMTAFTWVVAGVVGCGEITVRKITPCNTDSVEGFRYYMSRPYVAVKKPFPLGRSHEYLVSGEIVGLPDGSFAVSALTGDPLPEELKKIVFGEHIPPGGVPLTPPATSSATRGADRQSAEGTGSNDASGKSDDGAAKGGKSTDDKTASAGGDKGQASTSAGDTGSPDASKAGGGSSASDPVLKLNDLFDVVMLPDFDEEYAVQLHPSVLGKTTTALTFRDGWMLESVNASSDNTAVTEMIGKLADAVTSFIPKVPAASASTAAGSNGAAKTTGASIQSAGTPAPTKVVLRITVFEEAQPGLYPLLKPAEWRTTIAASCKSSKASEPAVPSCVNQVLADARAIGSEPIPVALPCPPYTLVPFNSLTRVTVAVAAAGPAAAAAGSGSGGTANRGGDSEGDDPTIGPISKSGIDSLNLALHAHKALTSGVVVRAAVERDKTLHVVVNATDAELAALRGLDAANLHEWVALEKSWTKPAFDEE